MKTFYIILMCVLLVFFTQTTFPQKPTSTTQPKKTPVPPPKIAIYPTDETDEDGWKKYISAEGKFSVLLPSNPERRSRVITELGKNMDLIMYTSASVDQAYSVGFLNYKLPINSEETLRTTYDGWQNGLISGVPNSKLTTKEIMFDGKPGREIICVGDKLKIEGRVFLTRGSLFQMAVFSVVQPTSDVSYRQTQDLTRKFFDSFKFVEPVNQPKTTSFVGRVENGNYINDYFSFSLMMPKNWEVASAEDTDIISEATKDRLDDYGKKNKNALQTSYNRTRFLFTATKNALGAGKNAAFMGAAESNPSPKASLAMIGAASQNNFSANLGYTITKKARLVTINRTQFVVIDTQKTSEWGSLIKQKLYMTKSRGYLLEFMLTYQNDEDVIFFDESMKTFKFKSVK